MKKSFYFPAVIILAVLIPAAADFAAQEVQSADVLFGAALHQEEVEGDYEAAIEAYRKLLSEFPDNRPLAARAQFHIGLCYEKLGLKEAEKAFKKVIDNYPEQTDTVKAANDKLSLIEKAKAVLDKSDKGFSLRKIAQDSTVDPRDLSPDGRYISYTDWYGALLGVFEVATGKKRYLDEKGSQMVLGSCFSPDGKWIAYNAMNEGSFWDLRIIDFEGSEPRVLYKEKGSFIHPVGWSPDGKSVLVGLAKMEGQKVSEGQIALVSIENGAVNTLKILDFADPSGGISAAFSPDGRYLAYSFSTKKEKASKDISVISMDGQEEFSLVKNPANDTLLTWTPDGKNILFISDRRGTKDLWMIGVENGKPKGEFVKIKTNIGDIYSLGFTKNGSFFYGMGSNTSDLYWGELDAEKGVLTSSPSVVVKPGLGANFAPEWSPDGKYMAYISQGQGDHSLNILSLETGEVREVSRPDIARLDGYSGLRWSPDGSSLLVLGYDKEANTNACITDIETGDMTTVKLDKTGDRLFNPAWSIDMKAIYYLDASWEKKLTRIMAHDIETGRSREIANDTNNPLHLDISPDGKTLAYAVTNKEINAMVLRTVDVSNGEKQDVVQIPNKGEVTDISDTSQSKNVRQVRDLCWAPDGRSFYCYILIWPESKEEDQIAELWNFPIDGGAPKRFYEGKEFGFGSLRFHPDGKRFVFRMQKLSYEIWAMENFLPEK